MSSASSRVERFKERYQAPSQATMVKRIYDSKVERGLLTREQADRDMAKLGFNPDGTDIDALSAVAKAPAKTESTAPKPQPQAASSRITKAPKTLTPLLARLLDLLAQGATDKQIVLVTGASYGAITGHYTRLRAFFDVQTREEMVRAWTVHCIRERRTMRAVVPLPEIEQPRNRKAMRREASGSRANS